jgi:hypothetical protein
MNNSTLLALLAIFAFAAGVASTTCPGEPRHFPEERILQILSIACFRPGNSTAKGSVFYNPENGFMEGVPNVLANVYQFEGFNEQRYENGTLVGAFYLLVDGVLVPSANYTYALCNGCKNSAGSLEYRLLFTPESNVFYDYVGEQSTINNAFGTYKLPQADANTGRAAGYAVKVENFWNYDDDKMINTIIQYSPNRAAIELFTIIYFVRT